MHALDGAGDGVGAAAGQRVGRVGGKAPHLAGGHAQAGGAAFQRAQHDAVARQDEAAQEAALGVHRVHRDRGADHHHQRGPRAGRAPAHGRARRSAPPSGRRPGGRGGRSRFPRRRRRRRTPPSAASGPTAPAVLPPGGAPRRPATLQPSMLRGACIVFHSPSASSSMVSRNTAPCATGALAGWGWSYSAHFRRVLPMSMARKLKGRCSSVRHVWRTPAGCLRGHAPGRPPCAPDCDGKPPPG